MYPRTVWCSRRNAGGRRYLGRGRPRPHRQLLTPGRLSPCRGFDGDRSDAVAAAGFRDLRSLAWGHYLYADDVSTLPSVRRGECGKRLMDWLDQEAARLGCEGASPRLRRRCRPRPGASALHAPQAPHLRPPLRAQDLAPSGPEAVSVRRALNHERDSLGGACAEFCLPVHLGTARPRWLRRLQRRSFCR